MPVMMFSLCLIYAGISLFEYRIKGIDQLRTGIICRIKTDCKVSGSEVIDHDCNLFGKYDNCGVAQKVANMRETGGPLR